MDLRDLHVSAAEIADLACRALAHGMKGFVGDEDVL